MSVPAGWKLVPLEAPDEMLLAAGDPYNGRLGSREQGLELRREAYRKIIAAAPEPPKVPPPRATLDEHCTHENNLNAAKDRCLDCGVWLPEMRL